MLRKQTNKQMCMEEQNGKVPHPSKYFVLCVVIWMGCWVVNLFSTIKGEQSICTSQIVHVFLINLLLNSHLRDHVCIHNKKLLNFHLVDHICTPNTKLLSSFPIQGRRFFVQQLSGYSLQLSIYLSMKEGSLLCSYEIH